MTAAQKRWQVHVAGWARSGLSCKEYGRRATCTGTDPRPRQRRARRRPRRCSGWRKRQVDRPCAAIGSSAGEGEPRDLEVRRADPQLRRHLLGRAAALWAPSATKTFHAQRSTPRPAADADSRSRVRLT